jgi:Tol biopolymer transport system component
MDGPRSEAPDVSSTEERPRDRLDSWKEIAAYLGRGITTAQRWEQDEALPVKRLPHAKKGSVFAFKSELDAWRATRAQPGPLRAKIDAEPPTVSEIRVAWPLGRSRFGHALVLASLGFVGLTVAVLGLTSRVHRTTPSATGLEAPIIPRPFANDPGSEAAPSFSPDGTQVVYHWWRDGVADLYIKPIAGGPAQRLTTSDKIPGRASGYPKWSPKGDLIAFLRSEQEQVQGLYLISPHGEPARRLTSMSGIGLSWTADGRSLAFVDRNSTGAPFSIFQISIETGERRRLTTPPEGAFGDTLCAFSPDGRRLAIVRYGSRYESDLYVMRVDAAEKGLERLTVDSEGIQGLDWTPDGQAIVFGTHRGLWKISTSPAARPRPLLVAGIDGGARHPSFSRPTAGRPARLVYQWQTRDVNIWRWDSAQGGPGAMKKFPGSTWWEDFPAISPDGRRIAFASNRTGANEIWIANADGSEQKQVTFQNGPVVTSPQWSPDGKRLAFSAQVGGNRDIYIINADGSKSTRLTWEPSNEEEPSWSRDGSWIYFRSDRTGVGQIWKVPPEGGSAILVTAGAASQGFESSDGQLLYFVRGMDVPGLWSVPVGVGKETLVTADVHQAFWGVADAGIYFIVSAPQLSPGGPSIRFFSFSSKTVSTLATLSVEPSNLSPGFSVSRDGRTVLWIQADSFQDDLMLIDPWKP